MKIKYLILVLLMCPLLGFSVPAKITIKCLVNETIDQRVNCYDCKNKDEIFSGLLITENGKTSKIYAPFKVKFLSKKRVFIIDAYGNNRSLDLSRIIQYNDVSLFSIFTKRCYPGSLIESDEIKLIANQIHLEGKIIDSDGDINDGTLVAGSKPDGTFDWVDISSTGLFQLDSEMVGVSNRDYIKIAPQYDKDFLFGSPSVNLGGGTTEELNVHNRFLYWNDLRSHFTAGRHNTLDITPQWRADKLAQYSSSFGWDQFLYGGANTTNGDNAKGQFNAGYSNRGWSPYTHTLGFQNSNGGLSSTVLGSENYLGSELYNATYDNTLKEWTIPGVDLTSDFTVGDFMGVRSFYVTNGYYTTFTGEITEVSFVGGNTIIKGEHDSWSNEIITEGQIFSLEEVLSQSHSTIIGKRNVNELSPNSIIIGNNNIAENNESVVCIGENLHNQIDFSQAFGTEIYTENGDVQTYHLYPKIIDIGSNINRLAIDGNNPFIDVPENASWLIKGEGVVKNLTNGTTIKSGIEVVLHRDGSSAGVIDEQTTTGGISLAAALFTSGTRLVFQFINADDFRGSFDIKIIQVK